MEGLSHRERELVALGAAMGSNCVPCIEYHVPVARKTGLTDSQILQAVRLADKVRQVPARKVLDKALGMLGETGKQEGAGEGGNQNYQTGPSSASDAAISDVLKQVGLTEAQILPCMNVMRGMLHGRKEPGRSAESESPQQSAAQPSSEETPCCT